MTITRHWSVYDITFTLLVLAALILMWGPMLIIGVHYFSSPRERHQLRRLFKKREAVPELDPFFAQTVYRCLQAFRVGALIAAFLFLSILVVALVLPSLGIRLF